MSLLMHSKALRTVRRSSRTPLAAISLLLMLSMSAGAPAAKAQVGSRLSWGPVVGWESPLNDMGDYLLAGPSFGFQLMYDVARRFSVGLETTYVGHDGQHAPTVNGIGERGTSRTFVGPPTQVLRFGVTGEVALLAPENTGFKIVAGAGAGLAKMLSEKLYNPLDPLDSGEILDLSQENTTTHSANALQFKGTNPQFSGLLRIGYVTSPDVTLYVEGSGYTTSIDEERSIVFVLGNDSLKPPGTWSSIGVRLGLRKRF